MKLRLAKPNKPICAEIRLGGCKSISHRALIIGLLAKGKTQITGLSNCQDVQNTLQIMRQLGAKFDGSTLTSATNLDISGQFDAGNSGTCARLIAGMLSSHDGTWQIKGDESLQARPMQPIITPLTLSGARFSHSKLPLEIHGSSNLQPFNYNIPKASAQTKSALMLASLNIDGVCEITEPLATRDHTENLFTEFSIHFTKQQNSIQTFGKQRFHGISIEIAGDPSSAAFIATIALLVPGSEIILRNINLNPTRLGYFETLKQMGADISYENISIKSSELTGDIIVKHSELKALHILPEQIPSMIDEIPLLALVASQSHGTTIISGLDSLKTKESNRLALIYENLQKLGAKIELSQDQLQVEGPTTLGTSQTYINCHKDHRLIMCFLIAGLISQKPIWCQDLEMVQTSFPEFWQILTQLGIEYE